ncbi:DNA cytosine methyltransferase [Rhizobium sp. AAP43]|uniref:DNA cytosine methyltransferase n=1 Tax=Rhizobium sp. AAP43 TaxID=1523420 RepID=UPI001FD930EE|nr:DNA cytosine methyltransferase [Rhizobium sp. AAP43]
MPSLYKGRPMIVDSFAGGGGASTGIEMALGRSPDIAINHNPAALALHAANHPETLHLSENVYRVDPLDHMRGRHIGLMHFSPDCKHFSKAKGGKPVERNIRDLAWIIPGWIERIQKSGGKVDVVTMENVEEWKDWGPLVETERGLMPCPERRGQTFEAWCKKIRKLGGKIEWRELRACDYGAPTIRNRLFLVIRFDGKPIVWPMPTHVAPKKLLRDGYGSPDDPAYLPVPLKAWRTAAEIIDWSLPCPSIFDTKAEIFEKHGLRAVRPLADNTMARVARGMKRYVLDAERPFLVQTGYGERPGQAPRCMDVDAPLGTVVASGIKHNVVVPHVMTMRNAQKPFNGADEPLHTITAGGAGMTLVAPVLTYAQQGGGVRSVEDPHHTITASGKDQNAVIIPHLTAFYGPGAGGEDRSANVAEPLRTITTENRHAVVIPTVVGCGGRAGQSRPRGGDEPVATLTTKADNCVATAFIAQQNNDSRRLGGVNPGRGVDEPLSTVTATGAQQMPVTAFIARQFGESTGHAIDEPLGTVTAGVNKSQLVTPYLSHLYTSNTAGGQGDLRMPIKTVTAGGGHAAYVAPYLQKYYGTGDGSRHDEPCHTVTTNDRFGHVEASIEVPPFRPEQEGRAREVADFMRAHGFWDSREFVTLDIAGQTFVIVDIGMRMLTPRELFNAQGFPSDYVIDGAWQGEGEDRRYVEFPKDVQVSCCGNSVSPYPYAALVAANCGELAEMREAAE